MFERGRAFVVLLVEIGLLLGPGDWGKRGIVSG